MTALRFVLVASVVVGSYFAAAASVPDLQQSTLTELPVDDFVGILAEKAKVGIIQWVQVHDYVMRIYMPVSYITKRTGTTEDSEILYKVKILGSIDFVGGYVHAVMSYNPNGGIFKLGEITTSHTKTDPITWE